MREIQASEAKTHLPALLDAVERGESIIITRHGRRIARISPEGTRREEEILRVIKDIRELGKRNGPATFEEIRSLINEGRE